MCDWKVCHEGFVTQRYVTGSMRHLRPVWVSMNSIITRGTAPVAASLSRIRTYQHSHISTIINTLNQHSAPSTLTIDNHMQCSHISRLLPLFSSLVTTHTSALRTVNPHIPTLTPSIHSDQHTHVLSTHVTTYPTPYTPRCACGGWTL